MAQKGVEIAQQGVEIISEPMGFKVMIAGAASLIGSTIANLDWAQVAAFIAVITGVVVQIAASRRNKAADLRERERHELDIALLREKLKAAAHENHHGHHKEAQPDD
jgi:hypothetical protein